jgi:TM2 domain-containing membrane protein YozV
MCWTFLPLCVSLINGISLLCMTGKEFDRKYNS